MTLAIIGSRTFTNWELFLEKMKYFPKERITHFVSGGAKGADKLGEKWADENAINNTIYYPNYEKYHSRAPFVRNKQIIDACDIVIAFWDGKSRGTKHALDYATLKKKKIKIFYI